MPEKRRGPIRRFFRRVADVFDCLDSISFIAELGWVGLGIGLLILLLTGIVWLAMLPASGMFFGRRREE